MPPRTTKAVVNADGKLEVSQCYFGRYEVTKIVYGIVIVDKMVTFGGLQIGRALL